MVGSAPLGVTILSEQFFQTEIIFYEIKSLICKIEIKIKRKRKRRILKSCFKIPKITKIKLQKCKKKCKKAIQSHENEFYFLVLNIFVKRWRLCLFWLVFAMMTSRNCHCIFFAFFPLFPWTLELSSNFGALHFCCLSSKLFFY